MKKILSLFLASLFLLSLFSPLATAAAKGKVSITGGPDEWKRGSAFDIEVELNRNPGFLSLRIDVAFDPLVLKVIRVTNISPLPGFHYDIEDDGVILRYKKESGANLTATGKLARIRFEVKEDAIYGDSAISPVITQKLYDAMDSAGKAVPFDTSPLSFHLACPHKNPTLTVLTEANFEVEGTAEETCPDCGLVTPKTISPTLSSEDGKTTATLFTGEYLNSDKKTLRTEYLHGGEEVEKATGLFSDSLVRCFKVDFTKNGAPFSPANNCDITLATDFELPGILALYVLSGDDARQLEMKREENVLSFSFVPGTYVLVSRSAEEPVIPESTSPQKSELPESSTRSAEEEQKREEIRLICLGIFAFLLCGGAAIIILRKKETY